MLQPLVFACMLLAGAPLAALAEEPEACEAHVILFVPADVQPPAGYQPRVDQMVDYAEAFFQREFKR